MEKLILGFCAIAIVALGVFVILKPNIVSNKIKGFYSNYPLVRHAGEKQLSSRNSYVVLLGFVILVVGIACLLSLYK